VSAARWPRCLLVVVVLPLLLKGSGCAPETSERAPGPGASGPLARESGSAPIAEPAPRFAEVSHEAGLTIPHFKAADGRFRLVETMGSGVGLIDFDRDGWLDLFVAQGAPIPRDPSWSESSARLYRNQRDGTFADVTERAGVGFNGFGQGVAVGDYDGDGFDDLFVAGFGGSALYRNRGDGTFTDVTVAAGVGGAGWPSSCAFADLDADGDLDLYVVHYLARTVDAGGNPTVNCNDAKGGIGYCPPLAFEPEADVLYRNNGDGTFTDLSLESGIASKAGNGLGLDGRDDLLVTNFYEEPNTLYRSLAPGLFEIATAPAQLSVPSRGVLGFGTGFLDFDSDGDLDLFVANGHINDVRVLDIPYAMPPQLFRNDGGRFAEVSDAAGPYFRGAWLGRAAAFGDLDNDGDTDVVVTHIGRPPALLRNDTEARGHFLSIRLVGTGAVGARVTAHVGGRTLVRTVAAGTSYLASNDPRVLLGLGESSRVDRLEVRWPSGRSQTFEDLSSDAFLELAEGGEPRPQAIEAR
jgi:hypothetical protein